MTRRGGRGGEDAAGRTRRGGRGGEDAAGRTRRGGRGGEDAAAATVPRSKPSSLTATRRIGSPARRSDGRDPVGATR